MIYWMRDPVTIIGYKGGPTRDVVVEDEMNQEDDVSIGYLRADGGLGEIMNAIMALPQEDRIEDDMIQQERVVRARREAPDPDVRAGGRHAGDPWCDPAAR